MGEGRLYLYVLLRSGPGLLNCAVWRVCRLSLSLQKPANETVHSWWPVRFCNSLTATEPSCRRLRSLVLPASFSARHISCNSALWRSCAVASSESTWSYKESQVVIVVTHLWLTCDSQWTVLELVEKILDLFGINLPTAGDSRTPRNRGLIQLLHQFQTMRIQALHVLARSKTW